MAEKIGDDSPTLHQDRRARKRARRGPPCRKFTLLDLMILIAGLAIGFAGIRSQFEIGQWDEEWFDYLDELAGFSLMLLSGLMLIFRLRRPRPTIRQIARQPGAVACFAAVAFGLLFDIQLLIHMIFDVDRRMARDFGGWFTGSSSIPARISR